MKVFEQTFNIEKVNFVDANNVFVGYDVKQHCCEDCYYYLSYTINREQRPYQTFEVDTDLESYFFDKSFYERLSNEHLNDGYDMHETAVFKLVAEGLPDLYLHLDNIHNGYYAHGFTFGIIDTTKVENLTTSNPTLSSIIQQGIL